MISVSMYCEMVSTLASSARVMGSIPYLGLIVPVFIRPTTNGNLGTKNTPIVLLDAESSRPICRAQASSAGVQEFDSQSSQIINLEN